MAASPRATMCGRASRSRTRWSTRCATPTASCCRPRATCRRRKRSRSAGRPRCASSRSTSSTSSSTATPATSGSSCRAACTTPRCARSRCCGLADVFGESRIPLYVLNVTYPLIDAELVRFCAGKKAILVIEEGQPEFIEQAVNTILRRADVQTRVEGKGMLPMAGEYTGARDEGGLAQVRRAPIGRICSTKAVPASPLPSDAARKRAADGRGQGARPPALVLHGLSGAADLRRHEARRARARAASRELRHRLPPVLGTAAVQHRQFHHGLRPGRRRRSRVQRRGRQARDRARGRRRLLAQRARLERRQRRLQQERQRA